MLRPFRKPLVVVAPKKLLKFRGANSDLKDFSTGNTFIRVIPEDKVAPKDTRKVIFCSG